MNFRSYQWILVVILVVMVGGVGTSIWLAERQLTQNEKNSTKGTHSDPLGVDAEEGEDDVVGEGVSFTITEADQKRWDLKVKQATYDRDHQWAKLKGVQGRFYSTDGKVMARFKAPSGDFNQENKEIILRGGVTVRSNPGSQDDKATVLKAPTVSWKSRTDNVLAQGGVVLAFGEMGTSKAERCIFSLDLSSIRLEGGVRSAFEKN